MSNSPELLKPDTEVTDNELQIEVGNLRAENERLQSEYNKLLASSHLVTEKLRQEVQGLRSQLDAERADREEVETQLSDLKQNSPTARELPEPADLLNKLKAQRKKSRADFSDIEEILEILGH